MADRQIAFALSTVTWPESFVERLAAALDAGRLVHARPREEERHAPRQQNR